ncbi:hypothetical protein BT96DRAFT_972788 [Gymnopus androsaceus JB14]|uniref:Uncharacterized protein n=1 Tax=Gymnopus androsaceus JB14 TaxID=1447944 RepID=A0A6A4I3E5_9AGAR|nr:hypothetical protein BT96DRAFT_972788 [Gymnopus androsaceus JB14]
MTRPRSYTFNSEISPSVVVVETYDSPNLTSHDLATSTSKFPNFMAVIKIIRSYLTSTVPPHTSNRFLTQLNIQISEAAHTLIFAEEMKGPEPAEEDNDERSGDRGLRGFVETALGPSIYLDAGLCRGYEELCGTSPPKDCKLTQNDLFSLLVASLLHGLSHSLSWRFLNHSNTPRLDEDTNEPESGNAFEEAVFGGTFAVVWERNSDKGQILKAAGIELRKKSNKRYYKVQADELKAFQYNLTNMKRHFCFQLNGPSSCAGAKIRTRPFHGDDIVEDEDPELSSTNQASDDEDPFHVTTHCAVAFRRMNMRSQ